jgi:hypothetical protein
MPIPARAGSLCKRHADAMVLPRGWTLDDRREAEPRLFRPRRRGAGATASATRRKKVAEPAADAVAAVVPQPTLPLRRPPAERGAVGRSPRSPR